MVEVITNSNDSYSRMESTGHSIRGEIIVDIQRKRKNSRIIVRDYAEGMNDLKMDRVVGTYGEATSGLKDDLRVRGLWGRGLKDAIFGLGYGYVRSIHENDYYCSSLLIKNKVPTFELEDPVPASQLLRARHNIQKGNGTEVEIIVSREDVKVPQFDNIRNHLQRHFELRPIMSDASRRIVLRELDGSGKKIKQEHILSYKSPAGEKVLDETIDINGFPAKVQLEVFRSNIPLSTRSEEGDYADGGLLVISKSLVLSLTMLRFENDPYASCFYGSINCDYLHDLLKKDEPVLTATRDGINWSHPFAKALKLAVETKVEPLVQAERDRAKNEERNKLDKRLREKLDTALKELNTIALSELGKLSGGTDGDGDDPKKPPYLPPSGFGFVPEYAYLQTGQTITLTLRASIPAKAESGTMVKVESDNPEIIVVTSQVIIEEREDYTGIGQAHVRVEGRQVGSEGIVTAYLDDNKAMALVQVTSKKEPPLPPSPAPHGGLFRDIKFDDRAEPRQRVFFDRPTSDVVIATAAPSVKIYLDRQNRLDTAVQGQVLLAELITEAVCREIARQGVERGQFLAPDGAETDAIQREFIRLQNQYAHRVHKCIVKID